jgi:serine phosphatase RsbU (regulator of sigma subunit)
MKKLHVFTPAIYFMSRLKFVVKFVIISSIFSLPLGILGLALIDEINQSIQTSKHELNGIKALDYNNKLLFKVAEYRDYITLQRYNLSEEPNKIIVNKKFDISSSLAELKEHLIESKILNPVIEEQLENLNKRWKEVSGTSEGFRGTQEAKFFLYDKVVQEVEMLAKIISYESKLVYDPNLTNFFLMKLFLDDIPLLNKEFGKLRAYGSYALNISSIDSHSYTLLETTDDDLIKIQTSVAANLLYTEKLDVDDEFKSKAKDILNESDKVMDYFYDNIIIGGEDNEATWNEFYTLASDYINVIFKFSDNILPRIKTNLKAEIIRQEDKLSYFISLSLLLYFLVTYLVIGMYYSLKFTIEDFSEKADELAHGDLSVQIKLKTRDELSKFINAFNTMASQLREKQKKLVERTLELDREKQFIVSVMDSQNNIVITLEDQEIKLANKAFFDFFGIHDLKEFRNKVAGSISDLFSDSAPDCIQASMLDKTWIEYIDQRQGELHKAIMEIDGLPHVFSISADKFNFRNEELHTVVFTDITELERIRHKIELINKNTRDSIEYASLIQNSIVPSRNDYQYFFEDSFIYWKPKDIVGGDIYIFDILKSNQECLSMVIDCTGHGVPGAFVTMLVKAIERKIIENISQDQEEISVSNIFTEFNKELKKILKQEENSTALSNVGFDGAILYYDKSRNIIKYSGSNTPLFYMNDGELTVIKGDKQSIGYKHSDINYQFNEHTIKTEKGMIFYITSDGYLDQNGGDKLFPFGKRKFKNIIEENYEKPLSEQKEIFIKEINIYKGIEEQTDDITLLGLKI